MNDLKLWKKSFGSWPTWPCPTCGSVALTLSKGKEKFLLVEETGPSKQNHSEDWFDYEFVEKRFSALLVCHKPGCGELVAVSGSATVGMDQYYDEEGKTRSDYYDFFSPKSFDEAPPVFSIPSECPDAVAKHLKAAFKLIWSDTSSAANRLRAGVEALLDDQGIQKTTLTKARKREPLSTHSRLEKLAKKEKQASDYLMAIKWIGNAGSHGDENRVERDDVLSAFELFETSIEQLYIRKGERIARIAASLNKRRGKAKKKRKPKSLWD